MFSVYYFQARHSSIDGSRARPRDRGFASLVQATNTMNLPWSVLKQYYSMVGWGILLGYLVGPSRECSDPREGHEAEKLKTWNKLKQPSFGFLVLRFLKGLRHHFEASPLSEVEHERWELLEGTEMLLNYTEFLSWLAFWWFDVEGLQASWTDVCFVPQCLEKGQA